MNLSVHIKKMAGSDVNLYSFK